MPGSQCHRVIAAWSYTNQETRRRSCPENSGSQGDGDCAAERGGQCARADAEHGGRNEREAYPVIAAIVADDIEDARSGHGSLSRIAGRQT